MNIMVPLWSAEESERFSNVRSAVLSLRKTWFNMMEPVKILTNWDGIDVDVLIAKLQEIKANSNGAKLTLDTELNYGGCYYAGDHPAVDLVVKAS